MTGTPDPNQELRLHPGWWARLEGQDFDLEALADAFGQTSSVRVSELDGRYYMCMAEFDTMGDSEAVETRACEVLRVVNGAARVEHANSREVRVDALARVQPDGQTQHFVHLSATVQGRGRVSATLTVSTDPGLAAPEPTLIERATHVGLSDTRAERALRIFGRDDVDYRDLYHVFEIAQSAIGSAMYTDGSITKAEVERFVRTANSVRALGDKSRHGHDRTEPPPKPTSFAEAQALVGRVLRVWLGQAGSSHVRSGLDRT